MPQVTLRTHAGTSSPGDLIVEVMEKTFDYLMTSSAPTIRVSAYLDRDWPNIKAKYAELFVSDTCPFLSEIVRITPGSRVRRGIELPGPMTQGEQLTVEVRRTPVQQA